jgi:cyclopropane fatty-acyl-phospholipid synthase-like methyltransferase
MDAQSYYTDLTYYYLRFGGFFGFHYGIWEDGVDRSDAALLRSNEVLTRDLGLTERSRVLDSGCGVGSFSAWCARRYGCRVNGITLVADHLRLAQRLADGEGVGERCRFALMDMNHLALRPAGMFDAVVNQETFCYATDKAAYLRRVFELLRPGGHWSAVEFALSDRDAGRRTSTRYRAVREGFHIPSLTSAGATLRLLEEAGFEECRVEDLTPLTTPTSRQIIRHCYMPRILERLRLDWLFFSRDEVVRRNHQGHFRAANAFSRGLIDGDFTYHMYRGRKGGQ